MKKNNFMEGAIIATLAIIISKILGVLYVIPFYQIIGEKGGALYGYAYNIYNIFLIISSAGIPLAISKLTSEFETKKKYKEKTIMYMMAKRIILIFSIVSFLICFLCARPIATLILGSLEGGNTIWDVTFVIRCVSFALLIVPLLSIMRGYLQGHKFIGASSFSQVIEQIVRIAVILVGSYIAIKVLNIKLTYAVGISVLGAAIGAIISFMYLLFKMKKIPKEKKLSLKDISKEEKKEIVQKIIGYSIPFIIVSIANSLYDTTDMILMIRTLKNLNYPADDIEIISSVFTTWGNKLVSIVKAFATGLTVSLIPSLVASFVSQNEKETNYYFNKALQVLLFVILPLTIFMSVFASQIWSVFYGAKASNYGPIIFKYTIMVAIFDSAYVIICSALQGLYKTKLVYLSVILGLLTNLVLDIPLMYLFDYLNIYAFYGAITATVIGYSISLGIPLIMLKKKDNFSYKETFRLIPRVLLSSIVILLLSLGYNAFIPYKKGFIYTCLYLAPIGLACLLIYVFINKRVLIEMFLTKDKKN